MKLSMALFVCFLSSQAFAGKGLPNKELDLLPAEKIKEIKADFVAENGSEWDNAFLRVNPYTGYVTSGVRQGVGQPFKTERVQAIEAARSFLLANRTRFGLEYWAVKTWLDYDFVPSAMGNVIVKTTHPQYYDEYASFPRFGYDVDILLNVTDQGVESFVNRSTRLTRIEGLETEPAIAFSDAKILGQIVGREMFFSDMSGNKLSAGKVAALDVRPLGLAIKQHFTNQKTLWIGLVWRYEVVIKGLSWELQFSAITGDLVLELPRFVS